MPQSTRSLLFDGSSGYVTVPESASIQLNSPSSITMACWVKWTASTEAYNQLLGKEATSFGYVFLLRSDGKLAFYLNGASQVFLDGIGSAIPTGVWTHLAATADGINLKTYINGILDATSSFGGGHFDNAAGAPLVIGGNSPFGAGRWFNGNIDDVLLTGTALSGAQIAALAAGTLNPSTLTSVGLWRFEEGTGTTTADSSGNANTGTLTGGVTWSSSIPPVLLGQIQVYAPEITGGPPRRGAPWLHRLPRVQYPTKVTPPVPPVPQQAQLPAISFGPPMRGAPWLSRGPLGVASFHGSPKPPPPPTPPPPPPTGTAANLPLLDRVPDVNGPGGKNRLRRFTEIVSSIINSLSGQGQLVQLGPAKWNLVPFAASAVTSFMGRFGAILLAAADVNTALGFTPANSAVLVSAGAGLAGGGPLTGNVTLSLPNVGTPSTFKLATVTTDAQGRVTSAQSGLAVADQQAVGAAAADAATTQTLANNLRTALIALGVCKT